MRSYTIVMSEERSKSKDIIDGVAFLLFLGWLGFVAFGLALQSFCGRLT